MGAGFNQTALFHDKDLVSITNRRQAMGDHYNRFILNQLFKGFLNQVLVLRVAERGCLVQNDNGRVFYDSPCNGNPLALTTGKMDAGTADYSLIPVRKLLNKFMADMNL